MPSGPERSLVAIIGQGSVPCGIGVLVGERHVVTCAHVVNSALGREKNTQDRPPDDQEIQLRFPLLPDSPRRFAVTEMWQPPPETGVNGGPVSDLAGLVLREEGPPSGADVARLGEEPGDEVMVFGYPRNPPRPAGGWVRGRLLGVVGGGRLQLDSELAGALRAQPGYSGSPVCARGSGLTLGLFAVASRAAEERDGYLIPTAALRQAWPSVLADRTVPPCPYRGLDPFDAADAAYFVGRERDTALLRDKLNSSSMVLVVGSSGVGKSSMVRAGLWPMLRNEGDWAIELCRPGPQPFQSLAAALLRLEDPGGKPRASDVQELASVIQKGGLNESAVSVAVALGQSVLLVVDQLEEIFRTSRTSEPEKFLETILGHSRHAPSETLVRVVATVRADFYPHVLEHPGAGTLLADRLVQLSPLDADQLRRVITEPATAVGVSIPPALADTIVSDATATAGALPLLEFALHEMWPRQRDRRLDLDAYADIGRIAGSIRSAAESTVAMLLDSGLTGEDVDRTLLKLVSHLDSDMPVIRRFCPKAEMTSVHVRVAEGLTSARLVTAVVNPVPGYELAHEALITAWTRIAALVAAGRDFLRWRSRMDRWIHDTPGQVIPQEWLPEANKWCEDRKDEISAGIRDVIARSETEHARRVRELENARDQARNAANLADALRLAAQAELASRAPAELTTALALATASLDRSHTFEGDTVARRLLGIATRPIGRLAHDGKVKAVVFSPDGRWVATASDDGTARVFDPATGVERGRLAHGGWVRSVAFSPDGRWVATASDDGTARVFDAATGVERGRLAHDGWVRSVVFSPDGQWVATASFDRTARVFDAASGVERGRLAHDHKVNAVVFSPDGQWVATASVDRTARVFDAATGVERRCLRHDDEVNAVAFSPDGRWVATASDDGVARVSDVATGAERSRLAHDGWVRSVVFSPDGRLVATASDDRTARVFDAATGTEFSSLAHDDEVNAVVFRADGRWVATASGDGTARVFDPSTGAERSRLAHDDEVSAVVFSPDGRWVATACDDGSARVFGAATNAERSRLTHGSEVNTVVFSPDGGSVATASDDGTARVFDPATGAERNRLTHADKVNAVVFSRDGRWLATAGGDGLARLFDPATGAERGRLAHDRKVNAVVFSPDGRWVATAGDDGLARVFDPTTGAERSSLDHNGIVWSVVFSPDGRWVATASDDGTARVFDPATGEERCLLAHDSAVNDVVFSPDGRWVATASDDETARVFDPATGVERSRLAHGGWVRSVAFSPDGRWVATASFDTTARVFDPATGAERSRLAHDGWVRSVMFSTDGQWVATASGDGTARVFDPATGVERSRLAHDGWVRSVAFSPDGQWVATASDDKMARVHWLRAHDLVAELMARMPRQLTDAEWTRLGGRQLSPSAPPESSDAVPDGADALNGADGASELT